jgi:hypothetical protein
MWLFAIVFIIIAPLFPLFVERMKSGEVRPESYLLTTAVLAVGYAFSSQAPFFWAVYGLFFFGSLGYDFNPGAVPPGVPWPRVVPDSVVGVGDWITHHPTLGMLMAVSIIQAIERFIWHVILGRQFPDWRNGG